MLAKTGFCAIISCKLFNYGVEKMKSSKIREKNIINGRVLLLPGFKFVRLPGKKGWGVPVFLWGLVKTSCRGRLRLPASVKSIPGGCSASFKKHSCGVLCERASSGAGVADIKVLSRRNILPLMRSLLAIPRDCLLTWGNLSPGKGRPWVTWRDLSSHFFRAVCRALGCKVKSREGQITFLARAADMWVRHIIEKEPLLFKSKATFTGIKLGYGSRKECPLSEVPIGFTWGIQGAFEASGDVFAAQSIFERTWDIGIALRQGVPSLSRPVLAVCALLAIDMFRVFNPLL